MGTVGEMVEVALAKRFEEDMEQTYCDIPELRSARNVMRSLGIWDAEILEGELEVRGYTECGCSVHIVGKEIVDGHRREICHLGDNYGGEYRGTPVRVIVLKGEEK